MVQMSGTRTEIVDELRNVVTALNAVIERLERVVDAAERNQEQLRLITGQPLEPGERID